jgi:hypothetical protein
MVAPIFVVDANIIYKVLVDYPIWPYVYGWNVMLNDSFMPTFQNKSF